MQQTRVDESVRVVQVDARAVGEWKPLRGAAGIPGPVPEHPDYPDVTPFWTDAGVTLVRSYDWVSRLDTTDNPLSLFPEWDADPADPASYNFAATDGWVDAVHASGAEVLFTFASAIPSGTAPATDLEKYGRVVEGIVRHYARGWADGPDRPIRRFEFGDQPDFGLLHFSGSPEQFHEMYGAFARAVRRVGDDLIVGGPSVAFPLNPDSPYREGFLPFVRERQLPLDFFSFLWFSDATRDPMDFRVVARELRELLDRHGFADTALMLSYWNYLGIPTSEAPSDERAAFQAAAAIYQQDAPLDEAIFFRADSGADPHYGVVDPAGIFTQGGASDEQAVAFSLIGRALSGERLGVTGSDESGFACAASRDGDTVRILIANFVAPESALAPRQSDELRFRVPYGTKHVEMAFRLPAQRDGLASAGVDTARIALANLPWNGQPVSVAFRTLHGESEAARREQVTGSGTLELDVPVEPQSVILVEVTGA
jgi:hypothetical protein